MFWLRKTSILYSLGIGGDMDLNRLKGKPDGSYIYRDPDGIEREGWMPPELLNRILESSGAQRLTHVVIREPNDEIHEDFWPVDPKTVNLLADSDGKLHVVSHLENGKLTYNFVSKRVCDNFEAMLNIMMDFSLSEAEKHRKMQVIMKDDPIEKPETSQPTPQPTLKNLLEKAEDAPVSFRILMEGLQRRLERDYPNVLLCPRWSAFVLAATVGGCISLAIRLHFDVPQAERTSLELAMREVLRKRFPNSEQAYEDCYRFATDSLAKIPRAERGQHFFFLAAIWVMAAVADESQFDDRDYVIASIAEIYQNETIGFWKRQ